MSGSRNVADALAVGPGPNVAEIGVINIGDLVTRDANGVAGLSLAALNALMTSPTEVPGAAYEWDNAVLHAAITYDGGVNETTLPVEASVTNWPPGSAPRRISKMNTTANGFLLTAVGNVTINGSAGGATMTVPSSNADPSNTTLAQSVWVYRQTATAFWVWGAA